MTLPRKWPGSIELQLNNGIHGLNETRMDGISSRPNVKHLCQQKVIDFYYLKPFNTPNPPNAFEHLIALFRMYFYMRPHSRAYSSNSKFVMATWLIIITVVWHASCTTRVKFAGDWIGNIGQLLLLFVKVFSHGRGGVLFKPVLSFLDGFQNLSSSLVPLKHWCSIGSTYSLLIIFINLATKTFIVVDLILQAESIVLQTITGFDLLPNSLVFVGELFGFGHHSLNLFGS